MDIVEFAPYVFQILALIRYKHALSDAYAAPASSGSMGTLWQCASTICSLGAHLAVGADQLLRVISRTILGVFQSFLPRLSEAAFDLLKSIILHVDSIVVDRYIMTISLLLAIISAR